MTRPTVRDRVVQAAIVNVIEPIFERDFAEHSYGFRPGRGCKDALRRVDELMKSGHVFVVDAGLTLHPTKTKLVDSRTDEFSFLGYTFNGTKHWPRDKSRQKLKDTLREKTKRTSGESLPVIIRRVNQSLRGWFEYFQHSSYANVFQDHDGWLRRRLRSLLRKRSKRRGIAKGRDNQRWPNAFFAKQGLFSLKVAHAAVLQSSPR